jgi:hypothetical protein
MLHAFQQGHLKPSLKCSFQQQCSETDFAMGAVVEIDFETSISTRNFEIHFEKAVSTKYFEINHFNKGLECSECAPVG